MNEHEIEGRINQYVELESWKAKVMTRLKVLEGQKCLVKTELAGKWTKDTES